MTVGRVHEALEKGFGVVLDPGRGKGQIRVVEGVSPDCLRCTSARKTLGLIVVAIQGEDGWKKFGLVVIPLLRLASWDVRELGCSSLGMERQVVSVDNDLGHRQHRAGHPPQTRNRPGQVISASVEGFAPFYVCGTTVFPSLSLL